MLRTWNLLFPSVDGPATGVGADPSTAALFFPFFACLAFHAVSATSMRRSFHALMTATLRSRLNCCGGLRNAEWSLGRRIVVRDSVCSRWVSGIPPGKGFVYAEDI